jgi:aspartyl-tRNA(Asn)/glutamyl-tRNA(Gln) amidotransferase subunit B
MRSKEEANDYRYFPDPDLLPVYISDELRAAVKADLPELPQLKRARFIADYKLDSETIVGDDLINNRFDGSAVSDLL